MFSLLDCWGYLILLSSSVVDTHLGSNMDRSQYCVSAFQEEENLCWEEEYMKNWKQEE